MFIACKYEEIHFPKLTDFIYMADDNYTSQDMRAMEETILKALDYTLGVPTAIHFLRRYSRIADVRLSIIM